MQTNHRDLIELGDDDLDMVSGGGGRSFSLSFSPKITFGGSGAYLAASFGTGGWAAVTSSGAIAVAGQNGGAIAIGFLAGPITVSFT